MPWGTQDGLPTHAQQLSSGWGRTQGQGQPTAPPSDSWGNALGDLGSTANGLGSQAWGFLNPAKPYDQQAAGLMQGAADSRALAALQWRRQMEGLGKALGYMNHSQSVLNSVYGGGGGPALPAGLMSAQAAAPAMSTGGRPAGAGSAMAPPAPAGPPGLQDYMTRAGMR